MSQRGEGPLSPCVKSPSSTREPQPLTQRPARVPGRIRVLNISKTNFFLISEVEFLAIPLLQIVFPIALEDQQSGSLVGTILYTHAYCFQSDFLMLLVGIGIVTCGIH